MVLRQLLLIKEKQGIKKNTSQSDYFRYEITGINGWTVLN
jgi:hypothetical protein